MNKLKKNVKRAFSKNKPQTYASAYELQFILDIINSDDPNLSEIIDDINNIDINSMIYQSNVDYFDSYNTMLFINTIKNLTNLKITLGGLLALKYRIVSKETALIYVYYLFDVLPSNTTINAYNLLQNVFRYGFFSDKQIEDIWNSLKIDADVDMSKYYCFGSPDTLFEYFEIWLN